MANHWETESMCKEKIKIDEFHKDVIPPKQILENHFLGLLEIGNSWLGVGVGDTESEETQYLQVGRSYYL